MKVKEACFPEEEKQRNFCARKPPLKQKLNNILLFREVISWKTWNTRNNGRATEMVNRDKYNGPCFSTQVFYTYVYLLIAKITALIVSNV